jgi:uncharacterized protein
VLILHDEAAGNAKEAMNQRSKQVIMGLSDNLMHTTRIEHAANALGYEMLWIGHADELGPPELDASLPEKPMGEHLVGRGALLLEKITRLRPALILVDLEARGIPWRMWVAMLKSVPATRRIPLVCYGPHVQTEQLIEARERGADAALARSRVLKAAAEVIRQYARAADPALYDEACQEPLSEKAIQGLELFNAGEYFEAHEELEFAWNEDPGPGRELYRAILQVAVAYLQIERGNYAGAKKMFLRLRQWLDPLPETCRGVDVRRLREDVEAVHPEMERLGPGRLEAIDRRLYKPVEYND